MNGISQETELSVAYTRGYNHGRFGEATGDCPYPVSTPLYYRWQQGFVVGCQDRDDAPKSGA